MTVGRVVLALAMVAGVLATGAAVITSADEAPNPHEPKVALQQDPLAGKPFVALARSEADPERRVALHEIAARRAPRDLVVRAWLAEHHLGAGRPAEALAHLDVILRISPEARATLLPTLIQLAAAPAFADALALHLSGDPPWRQALLKVLYKAPSAPGAMAAMSRLMSHRAINRNEMDQWIDALVRGGHWGAAYSLWAEQRDLAPGEPLPMFWNGDFDRKVENGGFDWRMGSLPGTYTEFGVARGGRGPVAHLVFLGRPVAQANLEHALQLPPGDYRLSMRLRAQGLQSQQGLVWVVSCDSGSLRSSGEALTGTFDWRISTLDFHVPITECPGQWLRLVNPAPRGSAQIVSGELWLDSVELESVTRVEATES